MRCPGSEQPPAIRRRRWADRDRFVTETVCRVCETARTLRKDGKVRIHRVPVGVTLVAPAAPRSRRVVTQK
jgi:hypothetical protein